MSDSTKRRSVRKPHPDFPLFPHQTGRWCKKVRGKLCYFGKTEGDEKGEAALARWLDEKDSLLAGRKPKTKGDFLTVKQLVNDFYNDKKHLVDSGELGQRTLDEYATTGKLVADHFGREQAVEDLQPEDFQGLRVAMAKRWGPVRLGNEISRVRMIFRHCEEQLPKPVQFGKAFRKPSAKVVRLSRAKRGPRDLAPEVILALIEAASVNMQCMILLGVNAGLGPTDLGLLKTKAIDLDGSWLNYARAKTGVPRRIPLWPETVKVIRNVLVARRKPKNEDNHELLFISPQRLSYLRDTTGKDGSERGARAYGLSHEFSRACTLAKIDGPTFYDLRRTFQTIAEAAHDLSAVQSIMGHAASTNDMSAVYRQRVTDERLLAVTEHVRKWLFGQTIST